MAQRPKPRPAKPDPVLVDITSSRLSGHARRRIAQTWLAIVALAVAGALGFAFWLDPLGLLAGLGMVAGVVGLVAGVPWAVIELTERQPVDRDEM